MKAYGALRSSIKPSFANARVRRFLLLMRENCDSRSVLSASDPQQHALHFTVLSEGMFGVWVLRWCRPPCPYVCDALVE